MKSEMTSLLLAARARLPLSGRRRHAVRDDSGVCRIFRLRFLDSGRTSLAGQADLLMKIPNAFSEDGAAAQKANGAFECARLAADHEC